MITPIQKDLLGAILRILIDIDKTIERAEIDQRLIRRAIVEGAKHENEGELRLAEGDFREASDLNQSLREDRRHLERLLRAFSLLNDALFRTL